MESITVDQWQDYVEGQKNSTIFHHRNWLELLHQQYGFAINIPAIVNNGEVCAAIPFLQTRNLRGKKKLISLPFTDYLPIVASDRLAVEPLCQSIQDELSGGCESIIIRGDKPIAGFENASDNVFHELKTDTTLDEIKTSFASSINRNIRKAQRQQLDFRVCNDDEGLCVFYRLHVLTRKKLGVPVQSKSYFQRLNRHLIKNGLGLIGVVTHNNTPIAAVVLLSFNGRLTYKYAASDPSALEHRPNDWLVYNAIRIAAEGGYQWFDFGISDKNQTGLRRFKSKWGASENDVHYTYLFGQPDCNNGPSRTMRFAAEVIKRSPTPVCRALGKAFYRFSQ